ncbi:MAG: hypothetical protein C0402_11520 [Thermodesulfovibrio sp.]|nr:hypothetical protein [Thermodesulfovibrio sp.]
MRGAGIQLNIGLAACIGLLLVMTPAYGSNIVIGGDYTDIGSIIVVSTKSGDTDTANGTALLNTLSGIMDNSAANRYLIKLGPGTYNLGANSLQMKPHVSIEGSGEEATTLTAAISTNASPPNTGTVKGADNAGLRFLTVENIGSGGSRTVAILNSTASPSIIHVTASSSGGTIYRHGVYNYSSAPTMTNVTATASGGLSNSGVFNDNSAPMMTNVTATASGGSNNYGVYNNSSSPTMTNVTATASGGTSSNSGVFNYYSPAPIMTNVTATASGGNNSYGIDNSFSSPTMMNVTAIAAGGNNSYGVHSFGSGTVKIDHSVIRGITNTITNNNGGIILVGSSQLDGGSVSNTGGVLTCVGAYNSSYVALGTDCH